MKIILASGSKFRQKVLSQAGIKFEVITSDEEETSGKTNPIEYVIELSKKKADNVRKKATEGIIIAVDTIAYIEDEFFEKPKTKEDAFKMIKKLSGKTNYAVSGVTIIDMYKNEEIRFHETTEVIFNEMTDNEINWYIENEEFIFNCAGYSITGKSILYISKIIGDYYNICGLPLCRIYNELKKMGYNLNDYT